MEPGAGRAALAAKQLVVSGAGRAAMELGRSAANLSPHCNKRVLMRSLTLVLIMVSKKRMFGEEIQRNGIEPKTECMGRAGTQIQMKFRREMHLEKKTVVVSMADRATKRVQQCSGGGGRGGAFSLRLNKPGRGRSRLDVTDFRKWLDGVVGGCSAVG